ncbi:MAG: thymidylate kinase [Clostridiales bacterium]|nr:MAG: thymidylate kinase [Clostridiales bacterium]
MGKLYIIDGVDGCGKSTQTKLLVDKFKKDGKNVVKIKFPNYDSPSSTLVKMYLAGELGCTANDVNSYAASSFYAVDRYASYVKEWKEAYESGAVIISDRYVSSNIIHQGAKLPEEEALEYFKWLYDFEYEKLKIPKPDGVFFLDVSPFISNKQVERRYKGDESKKDIHEKDFEYLVQCHKTGLFACEHGFMTRVDCMDGDKILTPEKINEKILGLINL